MAIEARSPASVPSPSPAATYFAEQLKTLMSQYRVRTPAGTTRALTPLRLQQMLVERYPDWRRHSQSRMYRLYRAEGIPYLDDICVIADFVGVSPQFFISDRPL